MKARYLTETEITALFARLEPHQRLIFDISIETGLRIGDVLKIRAGDVSVSSPEEAAIRYKAEKTNKSGVAVVCGKTASRLLEFKRGKKGFLWPSRAKCGHLTRQTAWNWIKAAAKAAEIDLRGVSPHSLRKCFAVRIRHVQGLQAAQRALQHTDSATTAIYAYADTYAGADPFAPVLWCQIDELIDLIAARLEAKKAPKGSF
jgi:integrase/recombinase XerD